MVQTDKKPFSRLGQNIIPQHYKLTLKIDVEKCLFEGSAEVSLTVRESCSSIVIYSLDLDVTNVELVHANTIVAAKEIKESKDDERIEFVMEKPVPNGTSELRYRFSGKLNDSLRGLYRCKSKNEAGEDVYSTCTFFAATEARRAFPCFDEPAMKATFQITLITKKDLLALSNTLPVEEIDDADQGWKRTQFETTPKMSTYLLCFVVGNYDFVEGFSGCSTRVRVYTPPGKKDQGRLALEMAVKSLDFFEDYFKIPYPLSKADLIAVSDFAMGAMENWGLITFRETLILADPVQSTTQTRKSIATVIAHEISHQWFGNLVTMDWWTYLWLNESFARFMQDLSTSIFVPEFETMALFPQEALNPALELDALDNSHPVEVVVNHPSEVEEIFDRISYEKGASIIRMLYTYLGAETFRSGLQHYMTKHAWGNTTTEDLWAALSEKSGQNIGGLMSSWIKQMGFPVLSVKSRESGSSRVLEVRQFKFCSSADKTPERPNVQWKVPIIIGAAGLTNTTALLDAIETEVEVKNAAKAAWIYVNYGAYGVCRVLYDKPMLDALLPAIRDQSLPAVDRYKLHADLVALVKAGYASSEDLLLLTEAYNNDTELPIWQSISDLMSTLIKLLDDQPEQLRKLQQFGQQLYSGIFIKLGWEAKPEEKASVAILRSVVLKMMISFEDTHVLEEARRRFSNYVKGSNVIPADLRSAIYVAAVNDPHSEGDIWETFMKLYRATDLQEEGLRIMTALGSARSKDFLCKLLELVESDAVRSQDAPFIIKHIASSSAGRNLAWAHFTANFNKFKTRYNSGILFHRLISFVVDDFHSIEKAGEVQEFFQKHPIEGGERTVRQSIENIETKAKWLQRDGQKISTFLSKYQ